MIAIVDTGGANHASIQNALTRLGRESIVTLNTEELNSASHLILPGVGHAGFAMSRLSTHGLVPYLREQTKPVLGICLGMQILFSSSEEGEVECLSQIPGRITKIPMSAEMRVPHMGWTQLKRTGRDSILLEGISEEAYFYFVHSYLAPESDWSVANARASASVAIPAAVERRNWLATQFHPERSSEAGHRLLKNFIEWRGLI